MYWMLNEMENQFGKDENIQRYRSHLCDADISYLTKLISRYGITLYLNSANALPAYLMECEEYKKAVE